MSKSTTPPDSDDGLTTEDKELFERLESAYEGGDEKDRQFAALCGTIAQSIEESNS